MKNFSLNQIVEGRYESGRCFGTFLIIGFSYEKKERWATVKEVNPLDCSEMLSQKLSLPVVCLVPIGTKMTSRQRDRFREWIG